VPLEGRFGIVLQRLDGPTQLQLSRSGAMTRERTGAILATLAISVHKIAPPPDVFSLRDTMGSSRLSGGMLPERIATGILTLIDRLAPGDGLCHGDLHPGNVIMTADGPRIIDWGVRPVRPPASTSRLPRPSNVHSLAERRRFQTTKLLQLALMTLGVPFLRPARWRPTLTARRTSALLEHRGTRSGLMATVECHAQVSVVLGSDVSKLKF